MASILITGANRGIGLALASQYLARHDTVVTTVRNMAGAAALASLQQQHPERLSIHTLDVTDEAAMARLSAGLSNQPLDVVICNAGTLNGYGGLADPMHDSAAWQRVLMTNVAGPYFTARSFLSQLERSPHPRIAIISSIMGSSTFAGPNAYPYRASKAAATNLAINLACELAPRKIAVAAYHPGWVRTDMGGSDADITPEESARGLIARIDCLSLATTGIVEDYRGRRLAI